VNIKLPGNMAVGLILPLSLISLDNDMEDWLGNWPPLAHLLEEVDWAEFFRQVDYRPRIDGDKEAFLEDLREHYSDLSEILDALLDENGLNLTGIIVRIDVASIDTEEEFPYFKWKHFYGYCETFAEVEGVIQSLIEKASQEVAV
jgi:hypothetical protein